MSKTPRELGGTPAVERDTDEIDDLVTYELTLPRHGDPYKYYAECAGCHKEWHGLARDDCPGATGMTASAAHDQMGRWLP